MVDIKRWIIAGVIILFVVLVISQIVKGEVVTRDRILYYDFSEGAGTVVNDKSGVEPLINLTISDPTKVEWISGGLRVKEATLVKSSGDTTKIKSNDLFSKGFTLEVWIKPTNNTQGGPARVVTFSKDSGTRNFTLGQSETYYQQRFRTSQTNPNGSDLAITTPIDSIVSPPVLQHVVYMRSPSGTATFYLDGVKVKEGEVPGDSSTWDMTCEFGLFNEINYPIDTRTWLGEIYLVAIYATVLTPAEILQNYNAGSNTGSVTVAWDANTEPDLKGYKIHYGLVSRGTDKIEQMQKWCDAHEPNNDKCIEEWEAICPEPLDRNCHSMLYEYDVVINVATQPEGRAVGCPEPYDPFKTECCEYTIKNLKKGKTYYLAATAYDTDNNESSFSMELEHIVTDITGVINLRRVP